MHSLRASCHIPVVAGFVLFHTLCPLTELCRLSDSSVHISPLKKHAHAEPPGTTCTGRAYEAQLENCVFFPQWHKQYETGKTLVCYHVMQEI